MGDEFFPRSTVEEGNGLAKSAFLLDHQEEVFSLGFPALLFVASWYSIPKLYNLLAYVLLSQVSRGTFSQCAVGAPAI